MFARSAAENKQRKRTEIERQATVKVTNAKLTAIQLDRVGRSHRATRHS
jgi:hypothetical protein